MGSGGAARGAIFPVMPRGVEHKENHFGLTGIASDFSGDAARR